MDDDLNLWLMGGSLLVGIVFGAASQRSKFCTVAAVSNLVLMRDYRQFHAYLAALGVALLGTGLLEWGQWVDIPASSYRGGALDWAGALIGGLIFGLGAMLAGGCATRTLVRSAEGNLGALISLLAFALVGMATLFGALEPLRIWLRDETIWILGSREGSLASILGWAPWATYLGFALLCLGLILILGDWRKHRGMLLAGALLGLAITAGWWVTGVLGQDEFSATTPRSVSIAGPLARGTAYLSLGQVTDSVFGLFMIAGVLFGAVASALLSRTFHWSAPAGGRVGSYLAGGAMMGAGAILASGCNVGNGLTGMATVSVQPLIAFTAIVMGMLLGLWWLQRQNV